MNDNCVDSATTFIGLKKTVALGVVASTMAIANPEYQLNIFDKKDIFAGQIIFNLFSQDVEFIKSSEKQAEEANRVEYNRALKSLQKLYGLKKGWDGYDADPMSEISLGLTKKLLNAMSVVNGLIVGWDVSPTGRKTVQIEKTTDIGYYEVEFFEDGVMACYRKKGSDTGYTDLESVDAVVEWIRNVVS